MRPTDPTPQTVEWMTPDAAARLLGISTQTLLRWEAKGTFSSWRTPGGHRRFRKSDLEDYLKESA